MGIRTNIEEEIDNHRRLKLNVALQGVRAGNKTDPTIVADLQRERLLCLVKRRTKNDVT